MILAREPKWGRKELAVGPKLAQAGLDEHGYVGRCVVLGAVDLRMISQAADGGPPGPGPWRPLSCRCQNAASPASMLGIDWVGS